MSFSPQSQSVIDQLLSSSSVTSGSNVVGPLEPLGVVLLRVVCDKLDTLNKRSGDDRAKFLRDSFKAAKQELAELAETEDESQTTLAPPSVAATGEAAQGTAVYSESACQKDYRLGHLECTSIRGLAPVGESVDYDFNGKSNLIYGPNGSGKTSLVAAVIWILTGITVSDAHESSDVSSVHGVPTSSGKGKKIIDWPVIATLPKDGITKNTIPACSGCIELVSSGDDTKLYLRRSIADGLESSLDGDEWSECNDLTQFGIEPLDLQMSLHAPTTFGRFTIESAKDTKSLLSLMLGYDDIESIGELATTMSGNRTRLANKEKQAVESRWNELTERLKQLPDRLPTAHDALPIFVGLASQEKISKIQIEEAGNELSRFIELSEIGLGEIIGLQSTGESPPVDLGDKLTRAILWLEKGIPDRFPTLNAIALDSVFPADGENASVEFLISVKNELSEFLANVVERIDGRLKWWRAEVAVGSKATLLLQASKYYEPASHDCPVCEQSIKDLAVMGELERLKDVDPELLQDVKNFFRNLCDELDKVVPEAVRQLATRSPRDRIFDDWIELKQSLPSEFAVLVEKYDAKINEIADSQKTSSSAPIVLLSSDADAGFSSFAIDFLHEIELARNALEILGWSENSHDDTCHELHQQLSDDSEDDDSPSLLSTMSVGKEAAAAIIPLKTLRDDLRWAYAKRNELKCLEDGWLLLEEVRLPLESLKALKKYAESEVQTVFSRIKDKTIDNWNILYPASSGGLTPARVVVGAGRDKSVTTFLSGDGYEVQGQFFGNAGLQRAVALSFYFALLEQHPRGLGFAIMDDPILSLDDGHRESWSLGILKPWMDRAQFVVATHQSHYLTNCRIHFVEEQVVELNPRNRQSRICWRPGNRLDRAEEELLRAPTNAPTEMRKYREDLLYSLDAYSTTPFFETGNLSGSLDAYRGFSGTHPLASKSQRKIVATLTDERVSKVLDPGSHAITEANVTSEMIEACHEFLKARDGTVRSELQRLETLRLHSRRQAAIPSCLVPFASLPSQAIWNEPIQLREFGRAAARGESFEVDIPSEPSIVRVAAGGAVLAVANTLAPVANFGQWLLLASEYSAFNDGDLVAVTCATGGKLLRRAWARGSELSLQSINPIEPVADVVVSRIESAVRKIVGVLYTPSCEMSSPTNTNLLEWSLRIDFQIDWVKNLSTVHVEGRSLDPIARSGQKVLVDSEPVTDYRQIANGTIAVIDSNVDGIGCVIKRVYHIDNSCVLTSVNPVEPHPPKVISEDQLATAKFWNVRGVLFESNE